MKFTTNLNYLGLQEINTKENKKYNKVAFVDGDDSISVFISDKLANKIKALNIPRFELIECRFNMVIANRENRLYLEDVDVFSINTKKG